MKKKKLFWLVGIIGCLLMIAALGALEQYYRLEVCNYESYDGEGHGYYVYPGATADSLFELMRADYEIKSMASWRLHSKHMLYTKPKTGYYHFPARVGNKHLIRRLQLGEQTPVRITFTKVVRNSHQLAGVLGKQLLLDSASIAQKMDSVRYLERYALTPATAVCMFIPNTYEVYWTITADQLFDRMQREYKCFWTPERCAAAKTLNLTPNEVYTLASIVESESNKLSEYPSIASLYLNRLRKHMALQACPTVIFAVGDFTMRRVLKRHLKIDSPYNTYINRGLPPGPIRLARGEAIDAVLYAPKTDYLYMCANPNFNGTHIFSANYRGHASVARQYQDSLNVRQILQ